jgi:hypothetical protein
MPTHDLLARKIFSSNGNKDVIQAILHDFFEVDVKVSDISFANPYSIDSYLELLKNGEIDQVYRQTITDVMVNIQIADFQLEIQVEKTADFMERSEYYLCTGFTGNFNKLQEVPNKSKFATLTPIYSLNVLAKNHIENDDFAFHCFEQFDRVHQILFPGNYLVSGYFELNKPIIEKEILRHWQTFFRTGEVEEGAPDYIKKAGDLVKYENLSKDEQKVLDALEKYEAIYETVLIQKERDGMAKGLAEGRIEGRIEGSAMQTAKVVKKMAARGDQVQAIAEFMEISEQEVRNILESDQ